MCNFMSGVVTPHNIYTSDVSDSHEYIIAANNIREYIVRGGEPQLVRVEFTIKRCGYSTDYTDIGRYELIIDQDEIPSWFDNDMRAKVERHMYNKVKGCIIKSGEKTLLLGGKWVVGGNVRVFKAMNAYIPILCGKASIERIELSTIGNIRNDAHIGCIVYSRIGSMRDNSNIDTLYGCIIHSLNEKAKITIALMSYINIMRNDSSIDKLVKNSEVYSMFGDSNIDYVDESSCVENQFTLTNTGIVSKIFGR